MDAPISHILVPVDYSDKSIFGLNMTANLIKAHNSKVTVIHVLKGVDPIWSDFFTEEERSLLLIKLTKHLKMFVEKTIDVSGVVIDYTIKKGKLCDTILETAESIKASVIVMGTSTEDNIKKRIIGSNALRVVSESKCPVITVKSNPVSSAIKCIVLPLDVTKETREKTKDAVRMAQMFGAEIKVISAYTINDEFVINKLENQIAQVIEYIKSHNVVCEGEILKVNDRVDAILNYIKEQNGDLIVLTTHQQLELVESFLGSFAKSIMRGAEIPVMSIVPKIKHNLVFKMPGT